MNIRPDKKQTQCLSSNFLEILCFDKILKMSFVVYLFYYSVLCCSVFLFKINSCYTCKYISNYYTLYWVIAFHHTTISARAVQYWHVGL